MIFTADIERALSKATVLHDGQYRKDKITPYIAHPISVALILSEYTEDEEIIMAGLLHDVLEDVPGYYESNMRTEFGDRVTDIVKGVTEQKDPNRSPADQLPWRKVKELYIENLKTAPNGSVMIAAADKIHNLGSLISIIQEEGEQTWQIFNSTAEERLWYFDEVIGVVANRIEGEIVERFSKILERFREEVSSI